MLRSLENLEFFIGNASSLEIQIGTQGKMIDVSFDLQAFQFEESKQDRKDRIVLGHDLAHRRLPQSGILF